MPLKLGTAKFEYWTSTQADLKETRIEILTVSHSFLICIVEVKLFSEQKMFEKLCCVEESLSSSEFQLACAVRGNLSARRQSNIKYQRF